VIARIQPWSTPRANVVLLIEVGGEMKGQEVFPMLSVRKRAV
jgi:hypothetical protein